MAKASIFSPILIDIKGNSEIVKGKGEGRIYGRMGATMMGCGWMIRCMGWGFM